MRRRAAARLGASARAVLVAASREADALGDRAVGTEHVVLGLATADGVTGGLLEAAGCRADEFRATMGRRHHRPGRPPSDELLASLGVDRAEVRRRAVFTFGPDAVALAAGPPPRLAVPWRARVSCRHPLPRPPAGLLAPDRLPWIPRVERLVARAARPGEASAAGLLVALLDGREPACEVLGAMGVGLGALARAARQAQ